jgi:hypothetical protein
MRRGLRALRFARCFGEQVYNKVVNLKSALTGELLFAEALHSDLVSPEANHPAKGLMRNEAGQGFSYGRSPMLERVIDATHDIRPIDKVAAEVGCDRSVLEKLAKGNVLYIEGDKVINLAIRTDVTFDEAAIGSAGYLAT